MEEVVNVPKVVQENFHQQVGGQNHPAGVRNSTHWNRLWWQRIVDVPVPVTKEELIEVAKVVQELLQQRTVKQMWTLLCR